MRRQPLGRGGPAVAAIGQGSWDLPEVGAGRREAQRALQRGIELGMTHLDTAEMYGAGAAEELLGAAIRGIPRESLFIASKVLPSNADYDGTLAACERSLRRLGVDYLDLYLLHWPSDEPLAESMRALAALVASGKARYVGVSNFDVELMLEAQRYLGAVPLACNQVLYHLGERGIEHRLIPAARAAGIAIVAYTPFGREAFPHPSSSAGVVLQRIAAKHGLSPRAAALAFLTRDDDLFAIPKAVRAAHVEENARAGDARLDDDDIAAIDAAFPRGEPRELATL